MKITACGWISFRKGRRIVQLSSNQYSLRELTGIAKKLEGPIDGIMPIGFATSFSDDGVIKRSFFQMLEWSIWS